jgi:alpha-glucosidase
MPLSRRALLSGAAAGAGLAALAPAPTAAGAVPGRPAGRTAEGLPVASRNSVFTRSGAGPLYWNIYGYSFPHNAPIPEHEWKANIDWLARDFAPHGYRMACTDGWIEGSTRTTEHGYITSYNDSWTHDWAYWARYLRDRDMQLGVYYNPLWVHKAAVADSSKTVVGRPDVKIADLVVEGDFFASDIGGNSMYWIDITRDGAKEYVQGYVQYFKDLGVPYLRVDFLSWYEDGRDANLGKVNLPHGRENYLTALRWMHEAAGEDMELSLVMPHNYQHAQAEVRYGDLIRINADADRGGWDRLSGGRQDYQNLWPNWFNPFAGFTGYADRSGRGQLILDGDFLRLHTFANDDERRTCISLMTVAGSPLTIADTHADIADHGWAFTNPEVLALHHQGLVGKPYFYNGTPYSDDPGSRDTERWAGQLPDGSWAVALFNRSDGPAVRSLDLSALGIRGTAKVRDVWKREDLGELSTVRAELPAHGCLFVTVTPSAAERSRYQAAFAAWGGGAGFGNTLPGHEAMGYARIGGENHSVTFTVKVPRADTYRLDLRYRAEQAARLTLDAERPDHTVVTAPRPVDFRPTGGAWRTLSGRIKLTAGENLVTVMRTAGDTGSIALNHIDIG